jgi:plastocyanin
MIRRRVCAAVAGFAAAAAGFAVTPAPTEVAAAGQFVTIKGQVVWPASKPVPAPAPINVTADKEHCHAKGPLVSEELVVNAGNKGVKNVWVYLTPANGDAFAADQIDPSLAAGKPAEHVVDQPQCQFVPRVFAARAGDTLLVKNSSPVPHNINFQSDAVSFNQTVPPGGQYKADKPLAAQKGPQTYQCNIHPWMTGKAMVFDHPYFAVTDADGKFEIKGAPAGNLRIFYRHELGYHKGRMGNKGFPLEVKAGGAAQELPPLEIELATAK